MKPKLVLTGRTWNWAKVRILDINLESVHFYNRTTWYDHGTRMFLDVGGRYYEYEVQYPTSKIALAKLGNSGNV